MWFVNGGQAERLGSPDGESTSTGRLVANVTFAPDDRVTELYVWTDRSAARVQGVSMKLASGTWLDGGQGRRATEAQLQLDEPSGLGSGLLLGVTAAAKPDSKVLSAVGFSFLRQPVSAAMSVFMPEIRIEEARFTPMADVTLSLINSGTNTVRGSCPVVTSSTVRTTTAYSRASDTQRLKNILDSIGGPDDAITITSKDVLLVASTDQVLASGRTIINSWSSEVRGQKVPCRACPRGLVAVRRSPP